MLVHQLSVGFIEAVDKPGQCFETRTPSVAYFPDLQAVRLPFACLSSSNTPTVQGHEVWTLMATNWRYAQRGLAKGQHGITQASTGEKVSGHGLGNCFFIRSHAMFALLPKGPASSSLVAVHH